MAVGVDLAPAGNGGGGLKPLIAALDRFTKQLALVTKTAQQTSPDTVANPLRATPDKMVQESKVAEAIASPQLVSSQKETGEISLPNISVPDIGVPDINVPETNIPDIDSITTTDATIEIASAIINSASSDMPEEPVKAPDAESVPATPEIPDFSFIASSLLDMVMAIDIPAKILADSLAVLAKIVEPIEVAIEAFGDAIEPVVDILVDFVKIALAPVMAGAKILKIFMYGIEAMSLGLNDLIDTINDIIDTMAIWRSAQLNAQKAVSDSFKDIRKTIANLLTDPMNAIPELMGRIREAVETFNPGAMIEFDLAMRDLIAVFGEALYPIVQQVTIILREFADTLRPILLKLQPVFQKLIRSITDHLIRNIDLLGAAFEKLLPLLESYMFYTNQSLALTRKKQEEGRAAADEFGQALRAAADKAAPAKGIFGGAFDNRKPEVRIEWDKIVPLMKQKDAVIAKGAANDKTPVDKMITSNYIARLDDQIAAWKKVQGMITTDPLSGKRAEFQKEIPRDQQKKDPAYMAAEEKASKAIGQFQLDIMMQKNNPRQDIIGPAMKDLEAAMKPLEKEMDRLMAAGKQGNGAEGLAAATNAQYKQAADLSRDIIQNAFVATSGAVDKKEDDNKKAVAMVIDLPNVIQQNVEKGMLAAMNKKQDAMPQNNKLAFAKGVA